MSWWYTKSKQNIVKLLILLIVIITQVAVQAQAKGMEDVIVQEKYKEFSKLIINSKFFPVLNIGVKTVQSIRMKILEELKEQKAKHYTFEEIKMLGDVMYAEVGVLFYKVHIEDAKLAHKLTGSVVINRKNKKFGGATSIKEVIYARGQYSKRTIKLIGKIDTPLEVYEWAEELLKNGPIGPENLVYQSQFRLGPVYKKIYNQYFCITK